MSRHGYSEDCGGWDLIMWRGAVTSAIRGKRGQAFLKEMAAALDAMPQKRLISGELKDRSGEYCAIGAVGAVRGVDMSNIDVEDRDQIAKTFGIAEALAAEIMYMNDDDDYWRQKDAPERRWQRMRDWVTKQIRSSETQEVNDG